MNKILLCISTLAIALAGCSSSDPHPANTGFEPKCQPPDGGGTQCVAVAVGQPIVAASVRASLTGDLDGYSQSYLLGHGYPPRPDHDVSLETYQRFATGLATQQAHVGSASDDAQTHVGRIAPSYDAWSASVLTHYGHWVTMVTQDVPRYVPSVEAVKVDTGTLVYSGTEQLNTNRTNQPQTGTLSGLYGFGGWLSADVGTACTNSNFGINSSCQTFSSYEGEFVVPTIPARACGSSCQGGLMMGMGGTQIQWLYDGQWQYKQSDFLGSGILFNSLQNIWLYTNWNADSLYGDQAFEIAQPGADHFQPGDTIVTWGFAATNTNCTSIETDGGIGAFCIGFQSLTRNWTMQPGSVSGTVIGPPANKGFYWPVTTTALAEYVPTFEGGMPAWNNPAQIQFVEGWTENGTFFGDPVNGNLDYTWITAFLNTSGQTVASSQYSGITSIQEPLQFSWSREH